MTFRDRIPFFRRKPADSGCAAISCQELVEEVTGYIEGTLEGTERTRLDVHLAACADCSAHLEQMQITLTTLGRLEPEDISEDAYNDLFAVFSAWKAEGSPAAEDPLA